MSERPVQLALRDAVEEVLEKMFFVQTIESEREESDSPEREVAASLTFEGSPPGSLTLRVTDEAARTIAADFLGTEEASLSSGQVGEVVCELANMICGSVLSRVESSAAFRLAEPRLLSPDGPRRQPETENHRSIHIARMGNGTLTAIVETRDPLCPTAAQPAS
jgi:CheY-specific phosphatase CheX